MLRGFFRVIPLPRQIWKQRTILTTSNRLALNKGNPKPVLPCRPRSLCPAKPLHRYGFRLLRVQPGLPHGHVRQAHNGMGLQHIKDDETVHGFLVPSTDQQLRICKHCGKVFFATHGRTAFAKAGAGTSVMCSKSGGKSRCK